MYNMSLGEHDSTLIKEIEYDEVLLELTIYFKKYYVDRLTYIEVPLSYFMAFSEAKSVGRFYLHYIKPNFLHKKTTQEMADKIIKIKVNVREINKDWIFPGEKGDYLNMTLFYNEEKDTYENNGMLTQDVPKEIYEAEKKLPKDKKTKGPILGNCREYVAAVANDEMTPGKETGKMGAVNKDDLPF